MTHRFLLLDCHEDQIDKKVFWLGIRGWLEILQYEGRGCWKSVLIDLYLFSEHGAAAE